MREILLHPPASADAFRQTAPRLLAEGAPPGTLTWRCASEPQASLFDPLDPDRILAERMTRAVAREIHKMHAFVRFRPVRERPGQADAQCLHLAWFDPAHAVLDAAAPFFVRRFARLRWSLLTPARSAHWDGERLSFDTGAPQPPAL